MKYQVQIKYTNPAHEHVSLRRRVDTVTRLVEAKSEQEALNRAANQQRALGFMIKEASVVKSEVIKEEVEQVTEAEREAGYKMPPAVRAAQKKSDALSKVKKPAQAGTLAAARMKKEEVEQIDERNKQNKYKKDNVVRQIGAHAYIQGVKKTMQSAKIAGREVMKDPKLGSKKVAGLYRKLPNPLTKEEVEQVSEAKVNVNDPKKAKIQIALNKIKARKTINMQPTLATPEKP